MVLKHFSSCSEFCILKCTKKTTATCAPIYKFSLFYWINNVLFSTKSTPNFRFQSDTDENYADKINADNFDAKSLDSVDQSVGEHVGQIEKSEEPTNVDGAAVSTRPEKKVVETFGQNDENDQADVDIVVTSPKGTETVVNEEETEDNNIAEENLSENNVDKEESTKEENSTEDKSEFVNSQGVTFKPTAETVDDSG